MSREEEDKETGQWYLDSGAAFHVTSDSNLLHDYNLLEKPYKLCTAANGAMLTAVGRGTLKTERYKVPGVLVVPGVQMNIISVSKIVEHGLCVSFSREHCSVKDSTGQEVGRGHLTNGLLMLDYLIIDKDVSDASFRAEVSEESSQANKAKAEEIDSNQIPNLDGMGREEEDKETGQWILHSCAAFHVISDSNLLLDYNLLEKPYKLCTTANGAVQTAVGHGTLKTERYKVPGVLVVPGVQINIISVSKIVELGLCGSLSREHCSVKDSTGREVGRGHLTKGFLMLDNLNIEMDVSDASFRAEVSEESSKANKAKAEELDRKS